MLRLSALPQRDEDSPVISNSNFLNLKANKMSYDFKNTATHLRRFVLQAECQIGKTNTYLALIHQIWQMFGQRKQRTVKQNRTSCSHCLSHFHFTAYLFVYLFAVDDLPLSLTLSPVSTSIPYVDRPHPDDGADIGQFPSYNHLVRQQ